VRVVTEFLVEPLEPLAQRPVVQAGTLSNHHWHRDDPPSPAALVAGELRDNSVDSGIFGCGVSHVFLGHQIRGKAAASQRLEI